MRIPDLIQKKRDNKELEDEEIRFFIRELVEGRLEDAQLGDFSIHFPVQYKAYLIVHYI